MSPHLQLFLGSVLLAFGVIYAWWSSVRDIYYQMDLLDLLDDLDANFVAGSEAEREYASRLREMIRFLARNADAISPPVLLKLAKVIGEQLEADPDAVIPASAEFLRAIVTLLAERPEMPAALIRARLLVLWRTVRFFLLESFSGWVFLLRAACFGVSRKTKALLLPLVDAVPRKEWLHGLDSFLTWPQRSTGRNPLHTVDGSGA